MAKREVNVAISGFKGAGKTTVAILLKEYLERFGATVKSVQSEDDLDVLEKALGDMPMAERLNAQGLTNVIVNISTKTEI